ncbi:MAG: hypothetical protein MJ239_06035 [Bacilli bacterium]|nr:hypothetical protein [Bacilli bacterium]
MKRLLICLLASFSLSSCISFHSNWRNEYGNPILFLDTVSMDYSVIYTYDDDSDEIKDTYFEIRDAMLKAAPFVEQEKVTPASERYFTYRGRYFSSMSGPVFNTMSVYDDGAIIITDRKAIGKTEYAYFSMDPEKAFELCDLAFTKISYENQVIEEDKEKAKEDYSIENFLEEKKGAKIPFRVLENQRNLSSYRDGIDEGELFQMIEELTFVLTKESGAIASFWYNVGRENDWELSISRQGNRVHLSHPYVDRLGYDRHVDLVYSIDSGKGSNIISKAIELAAQE